MIDLRSHSNFDGAKLRQIVAKGNAKAMVKAAAYVRGTAKRKVRRSKKAKSQPGQPPKAHSAVFKASILYGVENGGTNAVIGPARLMSTRKNAAGQPVPEILESGGPVAPGPAPWATGMKDRPRGNSFVDIIRFFKARGYGPAYWGTSQAAVRAASRRGGRGTKEEAVRGGKRGQYQTYRRYSTKKGRMVYIQNIRIRTPAQARKVAAAAVEAFGYPLNERGYIAPRPLMGPSMADSRSMIAQFWKNSAGS